MSLSSLLLFTFVFSECVCVLLKIRRSAFLKILILSLSLFVCAVFFK